jgi:hypothetical protein
MCLDGEQHRPQQRGSCQHQRDQQNAIHNSLDRTLTLPKEELKTF